MKERKDEGKAGMEKKNEGTKERRNKGTKEGGEEGNGQKE